jgi:hypothetical protein
MPVVVNLTVPDTSLPVHFWRLTRTLCRLPPTFLTTVLMIVLQVISSTLPGGPCEPVAPARPCGPARTGGPLRAGRQLTARPGQAHARGAVGVVAGDLQCRGARAFPLGAKLTPSLQLAPAATCAMRPL